MKRSLRSLIAAVLVASPAVAAFAAPNVQITEWMYNGNGATGEYVEFTNMGSSAVDFAGWSFDDDSRSAGVVDLSGFGLVNAGQSVILTEATASDFIAAWGLSSSIKVVGGNAANLGRADEMNLFDASGQLVDRFAYSDQTYAGTVRAQNASGNPSSVSDLTSFTATSGWKLAAAGDSYGSYASSVGDVGNPGSFIFAPVPEPSHLAMLAAGLALVGVRLRRRAR